MRLRAPFFGLARDLVVSGDQHVLISESGAEYQFGKSAMLIEARNLIGHPGVTRMHDLRTVTYYQILLDQHSCISVSGAWVDSLYVGTVAKMPEILATTALSQVPLAVLPVHRTQVHPTAQDFERRALLDTLTA